MLIGFYDPLFHFLEKVSENGFVNPGLVKALVLESNPEKLVERLIKEPWPKLSPLARHFLASLNTYFHLISPRIQKITGSSEFSDLEKT